MVPTSAAAPPRRRRRPPAPLAAFASALALAAPAAAQERGPTVVSPPPIEDTPLGRAGGGGAAPGGADPARAFPQLSLDVDMNLYAIGTPAASGRRREGLSGFLFGHINPGLHLAPDFSVQAFVHPDPAGDSEPNGAVTFLRRQNAILEQLFAEWRPAEGFQLYAGKFNAPFGYGYEYFPGVLASFRAHDVYLVREQLGAGANWRVPLPEGWGGHTLAAAVFTLDTSSLSNSLVTRRRCCDPGFGRYVRTTRRQGGAGNTGNLDSFAVSLEGADVAALPAGLTYNLGLLSRGRGKDGTRREWAWAAGLRHERAWPNGIRTAAFAEFVEFRNAGGNPLEEDADGAEGAVSERRRFSTLGAQFQSGSWRATLVWQRDEAKRSFNPLPTQDYYEASVGRDLARGFGLDVGYQHARIVRDDRSPGSSHSVVARLNHRLTR